MFGVAEQFTAQVFGDLAQRNIKHKLTSRRAAR
jgi:hypothetical protein